MTDEIRTTQTKKQGSVCAECHEGVPCVRHGRKLKVCDLCHRQQVIERLTARKIKRTLTDGCLVLYHRDGWRVGYLVSLGLSAATVQPLGGLCGAMPDCIRIPLSDIKPEIITSAKLPAGIEEYYEMNGKRKVLLVADQTSSTVTKAVEYLMNRPVEHTFGAAPVVSIAPLEECKMVGVEAPIVVPKKVKEAVERAHPKTKDPEQTVVSAALDLAEKVSPSEVKPRLKHAAVDLTAVVQLYDAGTAINDIVEKVRGTRAAFDVKKLVRKHLKTHGILKD